MNTTRTPIPARRRFTAITLCGAILSATLATAPLTAHAHGDEQLDQVKAPNGGQLRMAGPLHLELVLDKAGGQEKARPVAVYVSDHADRPLPVDGATGTVTLLTGKTRVSVPLVPGAGNRLTGTAIYAARPGTKAIVSVTMPGRETQQARFTPMDGHGPHAH